MQVLHKSNLGPGSSGGIAAAVRGRVAVGVAGEGRRGRYGWSSWLSLLARLAPMRIDAARIAEPEPGPPPVASE
jgi:hypothetical protein